MFSDSRAPGPGNHGRGVYHISPHLSHWLSKGLKPPHHKDMGLKPLHRDMGGLNSNGQCRRTEANNLTHLDRAKGIGFLSQEVMNIPVHGKDRTTHTSRFTNGLGLGRRLPFPLREHHVEPECGEQRGTSPTRWSLPSPEPGLSLGLRLRHSSSSVKDVYHTESSFVGNHYQTESHPIVRKCVTAAAPAPPTQFKGHDKVPVCEEEGKARGCARQAYYQRDPHTSSWVDSATLGSTNRHKGTGSIFSYAKEPCRNIQSQRDLIRPQGIPVEGYNGPSSLHEVIFTTEVPQMDIGSSKAQASPSKTPCPVSEEPRPRSEEVDTRTRTRTRPRSEEVHIKTRPRPANVEQQRPRREPTFSGAERTHKAVRDQIKRVVDNLEQVLGGLKDVHQEMKEVVQQIEYLTSSIDLSEEATSTSTRPSPRSPSPSTRSGPCSPNLPSDSSSSSSSSGVMMGGHQEAKQRDGDLASHGRRVPPHPHNLPASSHRNSPPQYPLNSATSPQRSSPHTFNNPALPLQRNTLPQHPYNPSSSPSHPLNRIPSPQKRSPVRPPTPGLSPLRVNPHRSNHTPAPSPVQRPSSPGLSPHQVRPVPPYPFPKLHPEHPALGPSVTVESQAGLQQTPHSDHPSAKTISPPSDHPHPISPPRDPDTHPKAEAMTPDSSKPVGLLRQIQTAPLDNLGKAPGPRGRKPPPYPHNGHFERTGKGKEPRKAPPHPVKKRLLSTTV